MTYPSGGFPSQGPHQPQSQGTQYLQPGAPQTPPRAPGGGRSLNLALILLLAVCALGLVGYFLAFAEAIPFGQGFLALSDPVQYMVFAALLTALHLAPKGPKLLPFIALLAVVPVFVLLDNVVEAPDLDGIVIVLFIVSILQAVAAVGALLTDNGVLKLPARAPQQPTYPGPAQFGKPGPFGQQGPFGGPGAPGPGAPGQPPAGPPQQTQYASPQGQFFQQPPSYGQEPGYGQDPGYGKEQRPPRPESEQ